MSIITRLKQWLERRRVRKALLATPGVDLLVRRVMDERYGEHNWRVRDGMLEALMIAPWQKEPWWGPIGPLHARNTRIWLRDGAGILSHAKLAPYKIEPPEDQAEEGYYTRQYADTEPNDSAQARLHNEGR